MCAVRVRLEVGIVPVFRIVQIMADETGEYGQSVVKTGIVGEHQVSIIHVGPDIPLKGGQHVMLVPVEYILEGIVAFNLVTFDASDNFQVFFGMNEDFQVEQGPYFFEVKNEDAFYDNDGSRPESEHSGFGEFVVENIFLSGDGFPGHQFFQILDEGIFIDGFRPVEIIDPLLIHFLFGAGKVVVVEGEHTHFRFGESGFEVFD